MEQTCLIKNNNTILNSLFLIVALLYTVTFTPISEASSKPEVTDLTINDAVEDLLLLDIAVPSGQIDVSTTGGVVTLKGSVDNILSKDRAANIARMVKGVKTVKNEIEVEPSLSIEDWQIRDDVNEALQTDPVTSSYKIGVSVQYNIVTLTGTVHSMKEKQLCEKVAKSVKGVKNIISLIDISWTGNQLDAGIKKEIEKLLQWDSSLDNGLIDVSVDHGKVSLKGVVGSAIEKQNVTLDSYVDGVKEVDNSGLEVMKWKRDNSLRGEKYVNTPGNEIEQAVRDALLNEPRLSGFKINVEVDSETHEVKLRGTVDNLKAKNTATLKARKIVGVRSVDNRIKVRPKEKLSAQKIEGEIKKAIARDPFLNNYVISVNVINGIVNLYGDVDTVFDKSQAEEVASGIMGVVQIDNNLIVKDFSSTYAYDPWVNDTYLYDYYWYQNMPSHAKKSDEEILKDIKEDLFWSPFVNADQVKVKVKDGVATLTGNVDTWLEHDAAMENAYKGGAIYVKNELKVR